MAVNYKITVVRQFYIHSYKAILITVLSFSAMLGNAQIPTGAPTGNISKEASADPPFSDECSVQDVFPQQSRAECAIVDLPSPGSISGTIVDRSGKVTVGADVRLTYKDRTFRQQAASGNNGQFSFSGVPPGNFQLTVSAPGFTTKMFSGKLHPAQVFLVPAIALEIGNVQTNVQVRASTADVAQAQLKEQEKQRVFAIIPNFYVTYLRNPAPLNTQQKFRLAFKTATDPVTFIGAGVYAGIEQAGDRYPEFGQGASGYAKRYAAGYADAAAGIFIGNAILPSILKQDPRYFYKGTGTKRARLLYALSSSVICKGDNQRWQPNYSFMLGSIAVGAISNLYVPANNRNSAALVFQNALIRIGQGSLGGILQEFLIPRLTPHVHRQRSSRDHEP